MLLLKQSMKHMFAYSLICQIEYYLIIGIIVRHGWVEMQARKDFLKIVRIDYEDLACNIE